MAARYNLASVSVYVGVCALFYKTGQRKAKNIGTCHDPTCVARGNEQLRGSARHVIRRLNSGDRACGHVNSGAIDQSPPRWIYTPAPRPMTDAQISPRRESPPMTRFRSNNRDSCKRHNFPARCRTFVQHIDPCVNGALNATYVCNFSESAFSCDHESPSFRTSGYFPVTLSPLPFLLFVSRPLHSSPYLSCLYYYCYYTLLCLARKYNFTFCLISTRFNPFSFTEYYFISLPTFFYSFYYFFFSCSFPYLRACLIEVSTNFFAYDKNTHFILPTWPHLSSLTLTKTSTVF